MRNFTQSLERDPTLDAEATDPHAPAEALGDIDPDSTDDEGIPVVLVSEAHLSAASSPASAVVAIASSRRHPAVAGEWSPAEATWIAPRRDAEQAIGQVIGGRYRLGPIIGVGGMATVFEATHTEIGKRVAIKVLSPAFDRDEEAKRRFRREATTASALESEHIARVFDVGEDVELGLYMVMECLSGEDLARALDERGPMSPVAAASVVWQVCLALEHAHAAGVVHRDVKPANVFLSRADDGTVKVKVLDFGIAKRVDDVSPLGRKDAVAGTPRYMSPEQARGLQSVNHLTDVYALGSLLFEAIAGSSPYPRLETSQQTLDVILTEDAPHLASRVQGVPPALDELVADLLARDPARRPSSAREVRHRLAAICSQLGQQPLTPSGPPPSAPRSTTREQAVADDRTGAEAIGARRLGRPLLLAVLAVAALACAVVARLW